MRRIAVLAVFPVANAARLVGQPAECQHCVPTFCGSSSECPGDCVCAIPMGDAVGKCFATR